MMKFLKYFIEAFLVYLSFIISKLLGLKISRKLFSSLFIFFGPHFRKDQIVKKNLLKFNKKISNGEIKSITNKMWSNYGMIFVEYIYLSYFRKKKKHICILGDKIIQNILKQKKPVIFVSGHFANFELMSMEITKNNIKLATIFRPLNNFFINPFMEYLRKKYICQNQIKKGLHGVRDAIEYIKKEFSIALMIDQRVSEGEMIDFFGEPALTTTLPAQLAIKYNLSIVPVFIERVGEDNFKIEFYDEIRPSGFKDKLELTKKLNEILEKMIVKNPNQWIWTHNRWK